MGKLADGQCRFCERVGCHIHLSCADCGRLLLRSEVKYGERDSRFYCTNCGLRTDDGELGSLEQFVEYFEGLRY